MISNCQLIYVRQNHRGWYVYTCPACGLSYTSAYDDPAMIDRQCIAVQPRVGLPPIMRQNPPADKPPIREKCGYFGKVVDYVECTTCKRGGVRMPVYACGIHGKCSLTPLPGITQCACNDYIALSAMPGAACVPSLPQDIGPGLAVLIPYQPPG